MKQVQIIVLIGNPGSGKTWVGEVLSRRLGVRFLDLEAMLLAEYGTTETFLANKPGALDWFENRVREEVVSQGSTVVFEAGAFSQRDTIRRFQEDFTTILALVEAPAELRLARLAKRPGERNLVEDPGEAMRYDGVFETELKPAFDFTVRIDNSALTDRDLVRFVVYELDRIGLTLCCPGEGTRRR